MLSPKNLIIIFCLILVFNLLMFNNYILAAKGSAAANLNNVYSFDGSKDRPFDFTADNIQYNTKLGLVIATGNVSITQDSQVIKADKMYIQKDKKLIIAEGNVYYKDKTGKELFGNKIELQNNLNNLIIEHLTLLFPDNSLLVAKQIKKDGNVSHTYNASYTTCKFSKFFSPFWSIKARKITYNEDDKVLQIYNGWFEIKNTPIIWLPYVSYADPTKKRKAGLLFPNFGSISNLGSYLSEPIFFPINDYNDLTITSTYFQNAKPMAELDYSSSLPHGDLNLQSSFTRNKNVNNWHIFSYYRQEINNTSRLTINYNDTSSATYLNIYPIHNFTSNNSFLVKNINLEMFPSSNDYFSINFDGTKNLDTTIDRFNNPYILPSISYAHLGNYTTLGKLDLNVQYSNLLTEDLSHYDNPQPAGNNFDFNKLATVVSHEIYMPTNFGVFSINSSIQNINYYKYYVSSSQSVNNNINNNINNNNSGVNKNLFDSYTGGNISTKVEYPISSTIGNYTNVISPIVQLAYSDILIDKHNNLSYLDDTNLTINSLNLFENNKFNGYDYFEQGSRMNYGVLWNLISKDGFNGKMLVGQSVALANDNKSNYLIYLGASPNPYMNISYEGSFNPNTNAFEQNNLNAFLGNNLLGGSLTYSSRTNLDPVIYSTTSLEELTPSGYIQLSSSTQVNVSATFDLKNNFISSATSFERLKSLDAQLVWQNNCMSFMFEVTRHFYQDAGINHATDSFHFNFILKNIGTIAVTNNSVSNNLNSIQNNL